MLAKSLVSMFTKSVVNILPELLGEMLPKTILSKLTQSLLNTLAVGLANMFPSTGEYVAQATCENVY